MHPKRNLFLVWFVGLIFLCAGVCGYLLCRGVLFFFNWLCTTASHEQAIHSLIAGAEFLFFPLILGLGFYFCVDRKWL